MQVLQASCSPGCTIFRQSSTLVWGSATGRVPNNCLRELSLQRSCVEALPCSRALLPLPSLSGTGAACSVRSVASQMVYLLTLAWVLNYRPSGLEAANLWCMRKCRAARPDHLFMAAADASGKCSFTEARPEALATSHWKV